MKKIVESFFDLGLIRQSRYELEEVGKILKGRPPLKHVLEIGAKFGGSLLYYSQFFHPEAIVIAIDPVPAFKVKEVIQRSIKELHLIHGKSQELNTKLTVTRVMKENFLDFLHIDGSHSYEDVKHDFFSYSAFTNKDTMIVIHDISEESGVKRFWNELKEIYCYDGHIFREFIDVEGHPGIGVITSC
jgi:cephalosporin hydroxylase